MITTYSKMELFNSLQGRSFSEYHNCCCVSDLHISRQMLCAGLCFVIHECRAGGREGGQGDICVYNNLGNKVFVNPFLTTGIAAYVLDKVHIF